MAIALNKVVSLDLVLKDDAGQVLEQTEQDEPFVYIHGLGQIVPGLERRLEGLEVGEQRELVVPPEEAYGMPDPDGVFLVPKSAFPPDEPPAVGDILVGEAEDGEAVPVRVLEVQDDEVLVDGNHPLAGQTLHYHVSVRAIRDATAEELICEHPHEEGHSH
jgi:FKBP-type peptidyl-prolyl cis-trans isomerase SlyD